MHIFANVFAKVQILYYLCNRKSTTIYSNIQIKMKKNQTFSQFYSALPRNDKRTVAGWACEFMMWSRSCFYYKMRGTVSKGEEHALQTVKNKYEQLQKNIDKLLNRAVG